MAGSMPTVAPTSIYMASIAPASAVGTGNPGMSAVPVMHVCVCVLQSELQKASKSQCSTRNSQRAQKLSTHFSQCVCVCVCVCVCNSCAWRCGLFEAVCKVTKRQPVLLLQVALGQVHSSKSAEVGLSLIHISEPTRPY